VLAEEDWQEDGGPAATREEVRQPAGGVGAAAEREDGGVWRRGRGRVDGGRDAGVGRADGAALAEGRRGSRGWNASVRAAGGRQSRG
jgi:hypothetical protein